MSAIDHDTDANGDVVYDLLENAGGRFSIHPLTGAIIIQEALETDDQNKEFMLLVEASDKGKVQLCYNVLQYNGILHIDGLIQERCNSSASTVELRFFLY